MVKNETKTISTTVPIAIYNEIKAKGLKFSDLLRAGFANRTNFERVTFRMRDMEDKLEKLSVKLSEVNMKNWKMESELKKLTKT